MKVCHMLLTVDTLDQDAVQLVPGVLLLQADQHLPQFTLQSWSLVSMHEGQINKNSNVMNSLFCRSLNEWCQAGIDSEKEIF